MLIEILFLVCTVGENGSVAGNGEVLTQAVQSAQRRSAAFSSFSVEVAGEVSKEPGHGVGVSRGGSPADQKGLTLPVYIRAVFSGERIRYEQWGSILAYGENNEPSIEEMESQFVRKKGVEKALDVTRRTANVRKFNPDVDESALPLPDVDPRDLWLTFRGVPVQTYLSRTGTAVIGHERIGSRDCLLLQAPDASENGQSNPQRRYRFWLDPAEGMYPMKMAYEKETRGQFLPAITVETVELAHTDDGAAYPLDSRYQVTIPDSLETTEHRLLFTDLVTKGPFPDSLFDLTFPDGTIVLDVTANIAYEQGREQRALNGDMERMVSAGLKMMAGDTAMINSMPGSDVGKNAAAKSVTSAGNTAQPENGASARGKRNGELFAGASLLFLIAVAIIVRTLRHKAA